MIIGIEAKLIAAFTTATKLLQDFWSEVKRVMNEKEIPNDL